MTDRIEEKKYDPYDDTYFTMTREQRIKIEMGPIFSGFIEDGSKPEDFVFV